MKRLPTREALIDKKFSFSVPDESRENTLENMVTDVGV